MFKQFVLITLGCLSGEVIWKFVIEPKLERNRKDGK